jgi:hypothetical protein
MTTKTKKMGQVQKLISKIQIKMLMKTMKVKEKNLYPQAKIEKYMDKINS